MTLSTGLRAGIISAVIFAIFIIFWHVAIKTTTGSGPAVDPEYAKLLGAAAAKGGQTPFPARWMSG